MHTRPQSRYVLPEFTERTSSGNRSMDPYSKLLEERIVFLGTPVDDTAVNDVMAQLLLLEHRAPEREVWLYINSPGGSVTAMTALYDTMRYLTCEVGTCCLGQAASAASVLLAAGAPGKRLVLPGARVVIHQPALAEPVHGQAADLEIQAREIARTRDLLEELLAHHTGQSRSRIAADLERDTIFDAQAAIEYGLADSVTVGRGNAEAQGLSG
ncbi:ATP-dependent Clp protease proteolytic subunit [Streptomyces sulphureus]|uniref:ATP-dependent Clp protease proteolytic subunit n=1 Tax=Streptomyces sulphureus TaxID=47758 RepID=UPI000377B538|nr:ATP-dependent Clp protease proteolytic subunit [Streptomyces sulphureus]